MITDVNDMNLVKLLEPMQKSSIRIEYGDSSDTELPVGSSKIGGKPDLPPDFEWYYFRGESFDGITETRPLSFLAQINCEEVSKYNIDLLLPSKGVLYFFYELDTMTWGFDPKDRGSATVYYYAGDLTDLRKTDFPIDLHEDYIIPEFPIMFSSMIELPDFEEFLELHDDGLNHILWEAYDEAKNTIVVENEDEAITKLLGYANVIQNGMLLECELASNGVFVGNSDGYANISTQQKENSKKWQLLLQLDSILTGEYEMLWGDVGRIYFYINTDDLNAMNFNNCWLILQCS